MDGSTGTTSTLPDPPAVLQGDCREVLRGFPASSVDCVVTSPPYFNLRNYSGHSKEIGLEKTRSAYVLSLLTVFDQCWRVLKPTGSLWVNLADTYRGGVPLGVPDEFHRLMLMTRDWKLINRIIWYKPDAMAESVTRRFSQKYELFYWFVKSVKDYYFDGNASRIPAKMSTVGRLEHAFNKNKGTEISRMAGMLGDQSHKIELYMQRGVNCGDLWPISTNKEKVKHAAPYPRDLIVRPILACSPKDGVVLDPFAGSGTTLLVAREMGRRAYGVELNPESIEEARERLKSETDQLLLGL